MPEYTLVISNPPHHTLEPLKAASILNLTAIEVRMKANYMAPEIWLADPDKEEMEQAAREFREAGMEIVIVSGTDLRAVPLQESTRSFRFTDNSLDATLVSDQRIEILYDAPIVAVLCTPRQQLAGVSAFLDLYVTRDEKLRRIAVIQDEVDFSGLGDSKLPSTKGNMVRFVHECEERFTQAAFDKRMADMGVRRSTVGVHVPGSEKRKGYSFATEALSQLLVAISPELKDINQFQLGSRLAYLTRRGPPASSS